MAMNSETIGWNNLDYARRAIWAKARGLCTLCVKRKPAAGKKRCQSCIDRCVRGRKLAKARRARTTKPSPPAIFTCACPDCQAPIKVIVAHA